MRKEIHDLQQPVYTQFLDFNSKILISLTLNLSPFGEGL